MQKISPDALYGAWVSPGSRRLAIWNRRLLIGAIVFLLWCASVLMLQAAGPNALAMLAGEGMLYTEIE